MELAYEELTNEPSSKPPTKFRLLREGEAASLKAFPVSPPARETPEDKQTIGRSPRARWRHSDDRRHHSSCDASTMKSAIAVFLFLGLMSLIGLNYFLVNYVEMAKPSEGSSEAQDVIRVLDPNAARCGWSPHMRYPGPLSFLTIYMTTYGMALFVSGFAFFSAFCAGQCGCLVFQAAILDIFVVHPLNAALYVLYRVLWPLRILWRHLLNYVLTPFVSFFHVTPSFREASLQDFVKAVPFAFSYGGMPNFLDMRESELRVRLRKIIQGIFPRITKWIPDAFLTNTIFRLALGYAMTPLAWWLVDEMYMIPFSALRTDDVFDASLDPVRDEMGDFIDDDVGVAAHERPAVASSACEDNSEGEVERPASHKALDVTFVFPKCKFLLEARKTYRNRVTGNKVCRRECRILLEELTGQLLGHQFKVEPNLRTARCTFSIRTEPWNPKEPKASASADPESGCGGGEGKDPLDW